MREKYYPTQRQAIPWLCPAHGSSQKGSPGEEKERRKGERGEGGEDEEKERKGGGEEERDKEDKEEVLNNCSCL